MNVQQWYDNPGIGPISFGAFTTDEGAGGSSAKNTEKVEKPKLEPLYNSQYGKLEYKGIDGGGAAPPEPVTKDHRMLLIYAAMIGFFVHLVFWNIDESTRFLQQYLVLWCAYLLVFHMINFNKTKERLIALPFVITALFLLAMTLFQNNGYSDDNLIWLNVLIVPCLLMLHAQLVTHPLPIDHEGGYIKLLLFGFFAQPFINIGRFFSAFLSLFNKKSKNTKAWLGVIIALPIAIVVLSLLLSADAVFNSLLSNILKDFSFSTYFNRIFVICAFTILFYSFLYSVSYDKRIALKNLSDKKLEPVAPRVVLITLLIIYLVFSAIQFIYLFGGRGLPEGLTYAEYARQGFSQLIWVSIINIIVFSLCDTFVNEDKPLKIMLLLLLAATGVILVSSFMRLFMYIGAYNLTFKRVQAFWMLCYLTALIGMLAVKIYYKKLPLLRLSAFILLGWYVVLNIVDLNALYALTF